MDHFLRYFYQDIGRVFQAFVDVLSALFNFLNYLLNFPMRMEIIRAYDSEFSTLEWILMLVVNLLLLALTVLLAVLLVKLFRRIFRFRVPVKKYDEMVKQVRNLQRDLLRANYEKDKLLALKVAELGLDPSQADAALLEEEEETAEADTDYSSRPTPWIPPV